MDGDKKKYPFTRTCMNDQQADYVIESVKEQYGNDPSWEIGEIKKENLSNGEVRVTIELTKDYSQNDSYRPRM